MLIEVKNLSKIFKSYRRGNTFREALKSMVVRKPVMTEAVKDISFSIKKGEIVGFLGPNGAGKSTTLKMLSGIMYPTSGDVSVLGYTPWKDRKKYVAHIGAVFGQKSQLSWDIPPIDAFYLNKSIYRISNENFEDKLNEMTELLDVKDIIRKPTRQLSLGERMKCEFIMAMLHSPQIVFLDEPTIGLDVIAKEKIRDFIIEMNKKGVTFILTTHDLSDVEQLASRVVVVNHGEIVFDDTLDAVYSHLGNKKIISVATRNKLPELCLPGIMKIEKTSDHNTEFELDLNNTSLDSFIEYLNKSCEIQDLSVQRPPIEDMIKQLYQENKDTKYDQPESASAAK